MKEKMKNSIESMKSRPILLLVLSLCIPLVSLSLSGGESIGGVTLLSVSPRVVTPNGDSLNDVIFFKFDTALSGLPVESSILDINGAKVSDMILNSDETALTWDGKDTGGRVLPSGIYLYAIRIGKNIATGTIVVAK